MNRLLFGLLAVGLGFVACSSSSSSSGDSGPPSDAKPNETGSPTEGGNDSASGCGGCCCPPPIRIDGGSNTCSVSQQCNLIGCGPCPG